MHSNDQVFLDPRAREFYEEAVKLLLAERVPFLVGGAFAFSRYTGIERHTKDFDIFVLKEDCKRTLSVLNTAGHKTEVLDDVWLAKAYHEEFFVDVIFSSANGVANVDSVWFDLSVPGEVLGQPVQLVPPEEMIWQKAYIMERDRFDGADVAHIVHACADKLNWERLLMRFGHYWRVLYMQLVLYGFVYPSDRERVPKWLMHELTSRLVDEMQSEPPDDKICYGTIFSNTQYVTDLRKWGYSDGRPEHARRDAA